jgi:serine protease
MVLKSFAPLAAAALLALAACGGGGGGSTPSVNPSPIGTGTAVTATPSPGPTAITLHPASLAFTSAGAGAPTQSVAVSQPGNTAFSLSTSTCGGIASVAPASGAGPFTFAPLAAGTCTYVASGTGGATAGIAITVTTTSVIGK